MMVVGTATEEMIQAGWVSPTATAASTRPIQSLSRAYPEPIQSVGFTCPPARVVAVHGSVNKSNAITDYKRMRRSD